jgi:hypothetical protein
MAHGKTRQRNRTILMSETKSQSWAPQVLADSGHQWTGNSLRFATKREAELNVLDLAQRWTLVVNMRVVESNDPVNYKWIEGTGLMPVREVAMFAASEP